MARDRYIAEFKSLRIEDGRLSVPLRRLPMSKRDAIPAWSAPGFPAEGINLHCTDDSEAGFSVLDGLAYSAGDTFVIVTTLALLSRFLAGHNRRYRGGGPVSIPAAFRSDEFWTFTSHPQAGVAAVVRGDRVWIAKQKLHQPLTPFTGCKHSEATERPEKSYQACFAEHLRRHSGYAAVQTQAQGLVDSLH